MGTSKSYGGAGRPAALPIWALDQPDADGNDNASNESPPKDEEIEGNKDAADDSAEAANHDGGENVLVRRLQIYFAVSPVAVRSVKFRYRNINGRRQGRISASRL